jgi:hypothetical protein
MYSVCVCEFVCLFVYLTLFCNHSVNNFISALDHFSLVQIRDMKLKAIARLWQGLQEAYHSRQANSAS